MSGQWQKRKINEHAIDGNVNTEVKCLQLIMHREYLVLSITGIYQASTGGRRKGKFYYTDDDAIVY